MGKNNQMQSKSLIFEVTQNCNFNCPHCYNVWKNSSYYPDEALSFEETIKMWEKILSENKVELITLTGGEPLLYPQIVPLIDFFHEKLLRINLISNGFSLKKSIIKKLIPNKISIFELPLLSSKREIHDEMSGNIGAFDNVTHTIANLKSYAQTVVGVFVATKLNIDTLQDTLELGMVLGLDGMMLNRFNPGGEGFKNIDKLQLNPSELRTALEIADKFSAENEFSISCSIAMHPCFFEWEKYPNLTFGFCGAGTERSYYTIDPVGNLRPCNHSATILGNVQKTSLKKLIQGRKLKKFAQARPKFCTDCKFESLCLGGCKAAAEVCYGNINSTEPFLQTYLDEAVKVRKDG